ncbi:MAG: selenium metabolism-associated LysR family transcriptional regulator [Acidobacteriota bacterium]
MDLRLLEIFCCAYEERSFSKAAQRLSLTQPTISGHIKTLETYFGTLLFDRLGREVRPTRAGELLFEQGRQIIDIKRNMVDDMSRFLNRLEGQLKVGASTIPGEYLLPSIVGGFRKSNPRLNVRVTIQGSGAVLAGVREGRFEVGFVGARPRHGEDVGGAKALHYERFASDRLVLAIPQDSPWRERSVSTFERLKELPLLVREPGSGTRVMLERRLTELGESLDDFNVVAEFGSTAAVKEAIKAGVGCSVISDLALTTEVDAGIIATVSLAELEDLDRHFYVALDERRANSPICSLFLETLHAEFKGASSRVA